MGCFIEPVQEKKKRKARHTLLCLQSNLQALMQTRLVKLPLRVITSINKNVSQ